MFDWLSKKRRIILLRFLVNKLKRYKIIQKYKAEKQIYKNSLPSFWNITMTKKLVWISIILTSLLWIIDIILLILSSPTLLSIPESAITEFTTSCRYVTVSMFATIVFYFIRAFMDSWNIARTGINVSEAQKINIDEINDSVNQMVEESNARNL